MFHKACSVCQMLLNSKFSEIIYFKIALLAWTCKRLFKKMAAKYHHIFDTFKHFWVACMRNFFDPSMAIGGAAISFFPNLNFWPKFFLENNIVKKIECTHFWNYVLSKRLFKIAKKWGLSLGWILVKLAKNMTNSLFYSIQSFNRLFWV